MLAAPAPRVAIVDYGLGNLFSVRCACAQAGLDARITSRHDEIVEAAAVILPGVGAFRDAMAALRDRDLVEPLKDVAAAGTPLFGVCLGLQLLMTESHEFGRHQGLGIVEGAVERLPAEQDGRRLKVPHIGWSPVRPSGGRGREAWAGSPLEDLEPGTYMYFVHSYYVRPVDPSWALSVTPYGDVDVCSSVHRGNIFACQFHPERSGPAGLRVYRRLAARLGAPTEVMWTSE